MARRRDYKSDLACQVKYSSGAFTAIAQKDSPEAMLSVFAPNGDVITVHEDDTLVRYCRQP